MRNSTGYKEESGVLTLLSTNFYDNKKDNSNKNNSNPPRKQQHHVKHDVRSLLRNKLISEVNNDLPGNRRNDLKKIDTCGNRTLNLPIPPTKTIKMMLPRQVRVSLLGSRSGASAHNSYVVIFESNRNFAAPITCVRLSSCDVTRVDDVIIRLSRRDVTAIELRARHRSMAQEWCELLARKNSKRGKAMPTLMEEDEELEVVGSNPAVVKSETLSSSPHQPPKSAPKQQVYHRSNSLNSFFKTLHSNFNRSAVLVV